MHHLRGLREVLRLLRLDGEGELPLERIAAIVAETLALAAVAVTLYRPAWDDFEVAAVHGPDGAARRLLGATTSPTFWAELLDESCERCGVHVVPEQRLVPAGWTAPGEPEALVIPLRSVEGALLGFLIAHDRGADPTPPDHALELLAASAEHVAVAIAAAQSAAAAARDRASLAQLLEISSRLAGLDTVPSVVDAVTRGVQEALGFEKVVIATADGAGGFVPRGAAGWDEGDEELAFSLTTDDLQAILAPELEVEGYYLCTNEEAMARVGNRSSHVSVRNGAGPLAWNRHWLLVPLYDRAGELHGFLWADDPEDRLLPSPKKLQALRTFTNQASAALRATLDFESLTRRNAELDALHLTTLGLLDRVELDDVLEAIVDSGRSLLNTEHGYLYLLDETEDALVLTVRLGLFAHTPVTVVSRGQGVAGRVWDSGRSLVVDDYAVWPERLQEYEYAGFHAVLGVPLRTGNTVRGVLGVAFEQPGRTFSRAEVALLERFAQLASLALENARLYAEAQREIDERRQAQEALRRNEEQLRQAQKMEAIGRLAGGIAHDFNNLLTAIGGYAELSLVELGHDDPVRENIEQIARAAERAASLTSQLLAYSRKQVLHPRLLDLNEVVEAMASMLKRMLGEDIVLSTELDPHLGGVLADPTQIEQVILNLALNARDAMPTGGTLVLRTGTLEVAGPQGDPPPGSFVTLSVEDSGPGVEPDLVERIFEPFFTTKGVGEGTGLGLSTVHGIVSQSGGTIWVQSDRDQGACFTVCLPRAHAPEPVQVR